MPQTQDTTHHPVTVYRHGANLSLCYPSMWNVTLEYTATHFNVLGETRPGNPFPTSHTHQRTFNLMLSWWSTVGSSVESTVPTGSNVETQIPLELGLNLLQCQCAHHLAVAQVVSVSISHAVGRRFASIIEMLQTASLLSTHVLG